MGSGDPSEIVRVSKCKRTNIKFGMKIKKAKGLSKPDVMWDSHNSDLGFGGNVGKNLIVGRCDGIFRYDLKKDKWAHVACFEGGMSGYLHGCLFGDSLFVVSSNGSISPHVSLLKNNENRLQSFRAPVIDNGIRKCLQDSTLFIEPNDVCHQLFCHTPIPTTLCFCTATNIDENKVMIIGGHPHCQDMKIFIGELNSCKTDFKWKPITLNDENARVGPIMFKMGGNIYIAGGEAYCSTDSTSMARCTKLSSCLMFCLKESSWTPCNFILPHPLSHASVFVSPDETFAVITGGLKGDTDYLYKWEKIGHPTDDIIFFTKEKGFVLFDDMKLTKKCFSHVSIQLTRSTS